MDRARARRCRGRHAALVGHSMGALACLAAAAHLRAVSKVALLGPAVPMPVSDELLEAAKADDHVAFELINGWSHSRRGSSAATGCRGCG